MFWHVILRLIVIDCIYCLQAMILIKHARKVLKVLIDDVAGLPTSMPLWCCLILGFSGARRRLWAPSIVTCRAHHSLPRAGRLGQARIQQELWCRLQCKSCMRALHEGKARKLKRSAI